MQLKLSFHQGLLRLQTKNSTQTFFSYTVFNYLSVLILELTVSKKVFRKEAVRDLNKLPWENTDWFV